MASDEIRAAAGRMQTKWYRSSKTMADDGSLRMDYIVDLCTLADAYYTLMPTLDLARRKLEEIVCTVGQDRGVVMLSNDGPTHYDAEQKCQVYDHENFSPLGDALIELHDMLTGISSHPAADDQPITEEWLRGLGWTINRHGVCEYGTAMLCGFETAIVARQIREQWAIVLIQPSMEGYLADCDERESVAIPTPTRGDLLRLLAALSITLEEKPNGKA